MRRTLNYALVISFLLTACGQVSPTSTPNPEPSPTATSTPKPEPSPTPDQNILISTYRPLVISATYLQPMCPIAIELLTSYQEGKTGGFEILIAWGFGNAFLEKSKRLLIEWEPTPTEIHWKTSIQDEIDGILIIMEEFFDQGIESEDAIVLLETKCEEIERTVQMLADELLVIGLSEESMDAIFIEIQENLEDIPVSAWFTKIGSPDDEE